MDISVEESDTDEPDTFVVEGTMIVPGTGANGYVIGEDEITSLLETAGGTPVTTAPMPRPEDEIGKITDAWIGDDESLKFEATIEKKSRFDELNDVSDLAPRMTISSEDGDIVDADLDGLFMTENMRDDVPGVEDKYEY